jgi:hypothetical protein
MSSPVEIIKAFLVGLVAMSFVFLIALAIYVAAIWLFFIFHGPIDVLYVVSAILLVLATLLMGTQIREHGWKNDR